VPDIAVDLPSSVKVAERDQIAEDVEVVAEYGRAALGRQARGRHRPLK